MTAQHGQMARDYVDVRRNIVAPSAPECYQQNPAPYFTQVAAPVTSLPKIAEAVRVKSSSLQSGEYDHRYKVRLTLQWKDFKKEVLVTLNNRTDMEFPLLIGRHFLRGDFLVDVAKAGSWGMR